MSVKKVIEELKKNNSFLITTHVNPEGDALGSELALRQLLLSLGKRAVIMNADAVPSEYRFLPGINNIHRFRRMKDKSFDAFLVVDCSGLNRCKLVAEEAAKKIPLIVNIDHHVSNEQFADVNWVEPSASSAAEMIFRLYKETGTALDKKAALWLYVGILTDTGSFRYPNTAPDTLFAAGELMRYHLKVDEIYRNIYENISFSDMQALGKIIATMRSYKQGKIVWFEIRKDFIKRKKANVDLTECVLNFGRKIKGAEAVVLFKENLDGKGIRVNLRSKNMDVNRIARMFGGGGHKNASGATAQGGLGSVRRRVIAKIKQQLAILERTTK